MKIRNPRLVRAAGRLATLFAQGLFRTLRFEYRPLGVNLAPRNLPPGNRDRHIYAIWHEDLLLPAVYFGDPSIAVLISKHADGQLLGSLITSLGMGMVLGSTNRDGVKAVRQLVRDEHAHRHLAVTPDGPRGPRRVVQPGIVYVASLTGMTIVCVGVGYDRPWRAKSWDRFAVPKPFSRAKTLTSEPIAIPPRLRADELEPHRLRVQAEMDRLNAAAERWAETNRLEVSHHHDPLNRAA
jgi:lysophospholipid acyltransferase (LPLAT)-like uncharacterized protein